MYKKIYDLKKNNQSQGESVLKKSAPFKRHPVQAKVALGKKNLNIKWK